MVTINKYYNNDNKWKFWLVCFCPMEVEVPWFACFWPAVKPWEFFSRFLCRDESIKSVKRENIQLNQFRSPSVAQERLFLSPLYIKHCSHIEHNCRILLLFIRHKCTGLIKKFGLVLASRSSAGKLKAASNRFTARQAKKWWTRRWKEDKLTYLT